MRTARIVVPVLLCVAAVCLAEDRVQPGRLITDRPTLECISFQWPVEGDDNHNAKVTVEFRKTGAAQWRKALDMWRVHGQRMYHSWTNKEGWYAETGNLFAGSIMGLAEGTEYECRLTMTDPDGPADGAQETVKVRTRTAPQAPADARLRRLGGEGAEFASFAEAFPALKPGDVLLIAEGRYELPAESRGNGFFPNLQGTAERPITLRGDGKVVIDGKGAFALFDMQNSRHVILENLELRGAQWCIWAGIAHPASQQGIVIRDCKFEKVDTPISGLGVKPGTTQVGKIDKLPEGGRTRHVGGPRKKDANGFFVNPEDGNSWFGSLIEAIQGAPGMRDTPKDKVRPYAYIKPGDTILIHGGQDKMVGREGTAHWGHCYFQKSHHTLNIKGTPEKPVVIRGVGNPVFDGAGNNRIFDLTGCENVVIEGITFRNARQALFTTPVPVERPVEGLTVRNCRFEDNGCGVYTRSGLTRDFLIEDCVFVGRGKKEYPLVEDRTKTWQIDETSLSAFTLAGQGHVIRHNDVSYCFDGIQTFSEGCGPMGWESTKAAFSQVAILPAAYRTSAIDITDNLIHFTPDNSIEADGSHHNVRVMRNLCLDVFGGSAFSNQPVAGGPVYWLRNVAIGSAGMFKNINGPVGVFMIHNTLVSVDPAWRGGEKKFGAGGVAASGWQVTDDKFVKCANVNVSYAGGAAVLSREPRVTWDKQAPTVFDPAGVALPEKSPAIDKVTDILPNINDDFEGKAPDAGAIEFGKPLPHYGPRPQEQR
jgi:hypothetical protein